MEVKTLDDFFREKKSHASAAGIDWEQRRKDWLTAIEGLYQIVVDQFLAKPVADGSVKVDYGSRDITENFLGTYKAPTLILHVGEERVTFVPKGRNIVGSTGRVDIRGEMGEATIILQPGPRWELVAQRVPTVNLIPFDANAFLNILKVVMRP